MQITITIDQAGTVNASLRRFGLGVKSELATLGYVALDNARTILKVYPPKLPNQRYIRTGWLGRSWRIASARAAGAWTLANNARQPRATASYSKWVVGNARGAQQAGIHRNRWKIARVVVERERERAINRFRQIVRGVARREGLGV